MRKDYRALFLSLLAVVISIYPAVAAPTAADVTVGASEKYTYTPTTTTVTAEGGNVTEVNVSAVQVTNKWVGFYGQVSGSVVLADSSGNYFYEWTISDPTGSVVYVTNGTVADWTTLKPLNVTTGPLPSHLLQGHDAFNYTFTSLGTFTSPSMTIANVNYTTTWQGGAQGTTFKTYALYASGPVLVWAGNVQADQTNFKGTTADYQILAGMDVAGGTDTMYFYLELA